ncbi:unnamed protein product [Linum tenue]|uniref:IBH1-like N-terminal domain-containing protein n=1 Tax=Linum tenue TaxID=586396 RepID=A0AAV0NML8_9ROSI|nr:unnamed protein product [Linum tenue]
MALLSIGGANPESTSTAGASSEEFQQQQRRKRRKIAHDSDCASTSGGGCVREEKPRRWRTEAEHRIYSTKLLEALWSSRRSSSSSSSVSANGKQVRDAADRVLAVAARGSTRWSRAILASRRRLSRVRKVRRARVIGEARSIERRKQNLLAAAAQVERKNKSSSPHPPPAVEKRIRTLSRLVPGCRKAPLPNLLEEVGDYIAALEMQVKAMAALAEILAAGGGGTARGPEVSAQ